jgi:hypothetical protein
MLTVLTIKLSLRTVSTIKLSLFTAWIHQTYVAYDMNQSKLRFLRYEQKNKVIKTITMPGDECI